MNYPERFVIKKMQLVNSTTCEVYMLNTNKKLIKGWLIQCSAHLAHKFYEQMNQLLQSEQPFQALMQLKTLHKIDVIR